MLAYLAIVSQISTPHLSHLVSQHQDGNGQNTQLKASRLNFKKQWGPCTSFYTVYGFTLKEVGDDKLMLLSLSFVFLLFPPDSQEGKENDAGQFYDYCQLF